MVQSTLPTGHVVGSVLPLRSATQDQYNEPHRFDIYVGIAKEHREVESAKPSGYWKLDDEKRIEYEVEEILDVRTSSGWAKYLVKWTGYDRSVSTWEPVENLTNC